MRNMISKTIVRSISCLFTAMCCIFFITGCTGAADSPEPSVPPAIYEQVEIGMTRGQAIDLYQGRSRQDYNQIVVYREGSTAAVILCSEENIVKGVAAFHPEKGTVYTLNYDPLPVRDLISFRGQSFDTVKEELGDACADTGSLFFTPAYLLADGRMARFLTVDGMVSDVIYVDLLGADPAAPE